MNIEIKIDNDIISFGDILNIKFDTISHDCDAFKITEIKKKTANILFYQNGIKIGECTKRLTFTGINLANDGYITIKINNKAFEIGTWEEV